jgi:hypothetical protein
MKAAEIHADMTRKKLREDSHESWLWKRSFAGKVAGVPTLQAIEEALAAGHKVKAGYTCTQIRGYHDRWILIHSPNNQTTTNPSNDSRLGTTNQPTMTNQQP